MSTSAGVESFFSLVSMSGLPFDSNCPYVASNGSKKDVLCAFVVWYRVAVAAPARIIEIVSANGSLFQVESKRFGLEDVRIYEKEGGLRIDKTSVHPIRPIKQRVLIDYDQ